MEIDNVKITDDGSHTLFVPELNEHYHSTNGAIQESKHVFIEAGLKHVIKERNPKYTYRTLNILEIGFGTGLNALLTLLESKKVLFDKIMSDKNSTDNQHTGNHQLNIFYHTIELYPLKMEESVKLNYPQLSSQHYSINYNRTTEIFHHLHSSSWEKPVKITSGFTILKQKMDFSNPSQFCSNRLYDLIYFDAFAPEKQPNMWTERVFTKIYSLCNTNAVLTTYCAKGVIRRRLQNIGFQMERLLGPPGKREILRGTKI